MVRVPAQAIRAKADDPAFQEQWRRMKQAAKVRALAKISEATGVQLPEHAMLDVQARRRSRASTAKHTLSACNDTVTPQACAAR